MKAKHIHEGCIEQIQRLFQDRLYSNNTVPLDGNGRIRIDDWEMRADVQETVAALWEQSDTETLGAIGDLAGYKTDFLQLFGFDVKGIDYSIEVDENVNVPGLVE
jgi:enoyl-[acyl-carrier protein] reductase/trans-2-enoyl-CoA reductase (NAD+)